MTGRGGWRPLWATGVFMVVSATLAAQVQPFFLRTYLSHRSSLGAAVRGSFHYKLSDVGLAELNLATGEYREYDRTDGLSGTNPTALHYAPGPDLLVVGYASGRLDATREPGNPDAYRRITDIERAEEIPVRGIRSITAAGSLLYVATDFGLVVYDLAQGVTRYSVRRFGSLSTDRPALRALEWQGRVWVLLAEGLYSLPTTAAFPSDPAAWRLESGQNGLPATGLQHLAATDRLWAATGTVLYSATAPGQPWAPEATPQVGTPIAFLGDDGTRLLLTQNGQRAVRQPSGSYTLLAAAGTQPRAWATAPDATTAAATDDALGLLVLDLNQPTAEPLLQAQSPLPTNRANSLVAHNGQLYVAPVLFGAGFTAQLTSLGVYSLNTRTNEVFTQTLDNGLLTDTVFLDLGYVALDRSQGVAYYGSWGQGVHIATQKERLGTYNVFNSGLPGRTFNPTLGRYESIFVGGITLEDNGTQWFGSYLSPTPLAARTPDGRWFGYTLSGLTEAQDVVIGPAGYKWVRLARQFMVVYDDQGDPTTPANHRQRVLTNSVGLGALPSAEVLCLAPDQLGAMWVGTRNGLAVFADAASVLGVNPADAFCPLLNGFCLLEGVPIQALVVDGANRKWIGTPQGLFYISPAGDELLAQFTAANSPLLTDDVRRLAYDAVTGELYIVTAVGIQSLQTITTEASPLNTDILLAPNPVYPDHTGPLLIRGLAQNSRVRITTISGELVADVAATGGQAAWDLQTVRGGRAQPGVYLVLATTPDGQVTGQAKVAIIPR